MGKKKTAFILSGGGSRGAYEIGAWQAVRELGIKIDIVCGTSVGAINAAIVAQDDFELAVDLWRELETGTVFDLDISEDMREKMDFDIGGMPAAEAAAYAKEILSKGGASPDGLSDILDKYLDEEKIRNASVGYGLTTVELPSFREHYMTIGDIPEGSLKDYIIASSSIVPALRPHVIDGKYYIDGGFQDVMPFRFAIEGGASDIIAVDLDAAGLFREEDYKKAEGLADSLIMISSPNDLGNTLVFDRNNSRRLIRLGYLDTMKAFGVLSGNRYTFPNSEFGQKSLKAADAAAYVFELDPCIIYKKDIFNDMLRDKIAKISSIKKTFRKIPGTIRAGALKNIHHEMISARNGRALVSLMIAQELKKPQTGPVLSSRTVRKIFKEEFDAAKYIICYDII